MEHKMIVARNLREGLRIIKDAYTKAFYGSTPFREQWTCFIIKETYDLDWYPHQDLVEQRFVSKSRKLLKRISGD